MELQRIKEHLEHAVHINGWSLPFACLIRQSLQ